MRCCSTPSLGRRKGVPVVVTSSSIRLRSCMARRMGRFDEGSQLLRWYGRLAMSMADSDVYLGGCALDRPVLGVMVTRLYSTHCS